MDYGWRSKVGIILTSDNTTIEPEIWRIFPKNISVHSTRVSPLTVDGTFTEPWTDKLIEAYNHAAWNFEIANVDVIVNCIMALTFSKGLEWDREVKRKMIEAQEKYVALSREKRPPPRLSLWDAKSKPVTTAISSLLDAIKFMKVRRIVLVSYCDAEGEKKFFENNNIAKVVDAVDFGFGEDKPKDWQAAMRVEPYRFYEIARTRKYGESDAIVFTSNTFRTVEILDPLETDTSKTVISMNQAIAWNALRLANIRESIEGYGSLLERPR